MSEGFKNGFSTGFSIGVLFMYFGQMVVKAMWG